MACYSLALLGYALCKSGTAGSDDGRDEPSTDDGFFLMSNVQRHCCKCPCFFLRPPLTAKLYYYIVAVVSQRLLLCC